VGYLVLFRLSIKEQFAYMLMCTSYEHIYCPCIALTALKHDFVKTGDEVEVKLHAIFISAPGSTLWPLYLHVNGGRAICTHWRPGGSEGRSGRGVCAT
jgi:hypothetical protein